MIERAHLQYKTEYKRRFQYIDCYNQLVNCPKLEMIIDLGSKRHAESNGENSRPNVFEGSVSQTSGDTDRPDGKKTT
ncbi:hypothetical protein GN244_ATG01324 [Phytophthora infestans]|uniref:Uncharacterized protein n=1 Tax=Phytophthora infestans TaxID=4787 RepID=A0A833SUZ7_PHYIN|nr:hypothetical protein GN244_ATG01324 [Phytophthora infestans]